MDTNHISVKVYHLEDGVNKEIRRLTLDSDVATNFEYLIGKIKFIFSSLLRKDLSLYWKDEEGDFISISSDDELVDVMMHNSCGDLEHLKLYVQVKNGDSIPMNNNHPGVTCDGCGDSINGIRHKCTVCPDFDLCSTCESKQGHPASHEMLCIKVPRRTSGSNRGCPRWGMANAPFWFTPRYKCHKFKKGTRGNESGGKSKMGQEDICGFIRKLAADFGLDPDVAISQAQPFFDHLQSQPKSKCDTQKDGTSETCKKESGTSESQQACKESGTCEIQEECKKFAQACGINMEHLNDVLMPFFNHCAGGKEVPKETPCEKDAPKEAQEPREEDGGSSIDSSVDINDFIVSKDVEVSAKSEIPVSDENESKPVDEATSQTKNEPMATPFPSLSQMGIGSELPEDQLKNLGQIIGNMMQNFGSHFNSTPAFDDKEGSGKCAENPHPNDFVFVDDKGKNNAMTEEEAFEVRLNEALQQMTSMGFDNEGDWLKQLLIAKDLDISKVLDALNPPKV